MKHTLDVRSAINATQLGVWELDLATLRATRSAAHDQIFGYPRLRPEWTVNTFIAHVVEDDRPRVAAQISTILEGGGPFEMECRIRRADERVAWIWVRGDRVPGSPPRLIGCVADITDRRSGLEAQARASHDVKDRFIATVAHELRQPLGPLAAALGLLRLHPGREAEDRACNVIERQIRRLTLLVDDLLDVARIAEGKLRLDIERRDVVPLIDEALESARPAIDARDHQLLVTCAPGPLWADVDAGRFAEILSNLLDNAVKYTEPGGLITVTVVQVRDQVAISVRDNGVGIAAGMLPNLFTMFTQVSSGSGLGIGLNVVRGLVTLHGGTVEAHSDGLGRGSEFIVRFPVRGAPLP